MMAQTVETQEVTIVVGLGEMKVTKDAAAVLTCLGLGSCVCVCCYDPVAGVGGMAHVVLPNSEGRTVNPSPKYADTAIPLLLDEMKKQGGLKSRLLVKLAGGAELSRAPGLDNAFKIGEKNQAAVNGALAKEGIKVVGENMGGNRGRTARMYVKNGRVAVSSAGAESKEL